MTQPMDSLNYSPCYGITAENHWGRKWIVKEATLQTRKLVSKNHSFILEIGDGSHYWDN